MTGVRNSIARGGAVLAAALFVSPAAAQDAPVVLEPSSAWHIDYADDSCRLARQFGEGDTQSVVYFEQYESGDKFFLLAAGKPLEAGEMFAKSSFHFGPGGVDYDGGWSTGEFAGLKPAMMVRSLTLVRTETEAPVVVAGRDRAGRQLPTNIVTEAQGPTETTDPHAIKWMEIRREGKGATRFKLGSMGEPMKALAACTEELMTHWGIDIEAHRNLTRQVRPTGNPGEWVTTNDYPRDLMREGAEGVVHFRLSIDATGKPTQCHIQSSTRPEGFDEVVCRLLMRRARFKPALGAEGQPIASYWRSAVRFALPR